MFTISFNPLIFIGPFIVRWYWLIVTLAFGIGVWLTAKEAERIGIKSDDVYGAAIWIFVGGIIGARLFFVLDLWSFAFASNPLSALLIWEGGISIWGAVIGGFVAAALVCWKRGWSFPTFLDVAAPGLVLGLSVGRIACILTGDGVGIPTSGLLGLAYTNSNTLAPHVRVFYTPVPAYDMIGNLVIFGILWQLRNRKWAEGTLFLVYLLLYSIERYFLGFISADRFIAVGLKQAQIIALVAFSIAIPALIFRSLRYDKQAV